MKIFPPPALYILILVLLRDYSRERLSNVLPPKTTKKESLKLIKTLAHPYIPSPMDHHGLLL